MSNAKLSKDEIDALKRRVRKRDNHKCILCGKQTGFVHEIVPKSHGGKRSDKIFAMKNMCCLCANCHMQLHFSSEIGIKKERTDTAKSIMTMRHGYRY